MPAKNKIFMSAETEGKHKPLSEQKSSSGDTCNVKLKLYISTIFIKNLNTITSTFITKSVDDDSNKRV